MAPMESKFVSKNIKKRNYLYGTLVLRWEKERKNKK